MKIISEIIGGSHLYGLFTPSSDIDRRGVFLSTEFSKILGLERLETIKEEIEDSVYFEFSHFLKSLRKTNTQMIELLFAQTPSFIQITDEFIFVRENKYRLIDSDLFFKSLIGYIENEKRLANGERTGNLGSKRKQAIDTYGFSPKNFSHLFRLAYCGRIFFETGHYPVSVRFEDKQMGEFLFSVKTQPEKYTKNQLMEIADEFLIKLVEAFNKKHVNFKFDLDFANHLCHKFYFPYLVI